MHLQKQFIHKRRYNNRWLPILLLLKRLK
uniref:Uncharacterized protein n=1 Tax=Anguilla anguilla TaxID=7936 RepID=A0A0E9PKE2_ANGAN